MGEPRPCVGPKDIARTLGMMTIEEQIATWLAEHERTEVNGDGSRKVLSGTEIVGYIVVLSTDLP